MSALGDDVTGVKWLKIHDNVYLCGPTAVKPPVIRLTGYT